jgi:hypothetical protein
MEDRFRPQRIENQVSETFSGSHHYRAEPELTSGRVFAGSAMRWPVGR